MTKDNGCAGSYSVSGYTRSDGTEVSEYTRTCGAAHNSSGSSGSSTSTPKLDDEEKIKQRADLLYSTMKDKKQTGNNKILSAHISKDVYKKLNKKNDFSNFLENLYRYFSKNLAFPII